jgi:hypothetical protein
VWSVSGFSRSRTVRLAADNDRFTGGEEIKEQDATSDQAASGQRLRTADSDLELII